MKTSRIFIIVLIVAAIAACVYFLPITTHEMQLKGAPISSKIYESEGSQILLIGDDNDGYAFFGDTAVYVDDSRVSYVQVSNLSVISLNLPDEYEGEVYILRKCDKEKLLSHELSDEDISELFESRKQDVGISNK